MIETQQTINEWALHTFGPCSGERAIYRMVEEVDELVELCENEGIDDVNKVANECADILITLYQVASIFEFDLQERVNQKMQVNRLRKWKIAEDGTGQHIKE